MPIDDEEVKKAVFQMRPDKSPGPDCMSLGFYQKYWHIVGDKVKQVVRSFWRDERFDDHFPLTNIVLIPKKRPLRL